MNLLRVVHLLLLPTPAHAGLSSRTESAVAVAPEQGVTDINACIAVVRAALEDVKAQNIVQIDVRDLTNVTDTIMIASGTSTRHVQSLANNVAFEAKQAGFAPLGIEGERDAEWILVDLGYVVVHVMLPAARNFYDLESLWKAKSNA